MKCRKKSVMKKPTALTAKDITVYPQFCVFYRKGGLADGPYFCEDDKGGIAFVSHEAKKAYAAREAHCMSALRR